MRDLGLNFHQLHFLFIFSYFTWNAKRLSRRTGLSAIAELLMVTEAVTGPITNSIVLGSVHCQHVSNIFDARLSNAIISTVHLAETVIRRKILGRT